MNIGMDVIVDASLDISGSIANVNLALKELSMMAVNVLKDKSARVVMALINSGMAMLVCVFQDSSRLTNTV